MKTLFKLAMGAAIAGALVSMAMRQIHQRGAGQGRNREPQLPHLDNPPQGESGFTLAELAADHGSAGIDEQGDGDDDRLRSAGEGRAGEKVLNS